MKRWIKFRMRRARLEPGIYIANLIVHLVGRPRGEKIDEALD